MSERCARVRDLIQPFLDGELEVNQTVELMKHFQLCVSCRERCNAERALHAVLAAAATASLDEVSRARILEGAFARVDAASARRGWLRGLVVAAGVFFAATAGYLGHADPFCWWGCGTLDQIESYTAASLELVEAVPQDPPAYCGLTLKAVFRSDPAGLPPRRVLEMACDKSGVCVNVFRIPQGHAHGLARRKDGREYFEHVLKDGTRLVGWQDASGVYYCVESTPRELEGDTLYVLAAAIRDGDVSF